eukprot:6506267-Karenia_brevis.AAC.1
MSQAPGTLRWMVWIRWLVERGLGQLCPGGQGIPSRLGHSQRDSSQNLWIMPEGIGDKLPKPT